MEIASRIHHFTNHKFNWYVIEDQSKITVVDTGFPGHYKLLKAGLESIGRSVHDVEAIVITHAHADHTGFAPRLARESGARIYVHHDDVRYVARPLYLPWVGLLTNAWRPYTASMLAHAIGHGLLRFPRITAPTPISHGDTLDIPGRPTVIHLPGHTRGDIVLHLPDRGVLFSGDALVTRSLYTGRPTPPQVTSPLLNTNHKQAIEQLHRLNNLGSIHLLPGHGEPWTGDIRSAITDATDV